jgi:hypothetical protein
MSVRSRQRITTRQLEALVAFLEENLAENRKLLQNEAGIVGRKQMDNLKTILNNDLEGPKRSVEEWKRVFHYLFVLKKVCF